MHLMSSSFVHGQRIPDEFAFCAPDPAQHVRMSGNRNPHLRWTGVPSTARSLVLLCVDTDVPTRPDDVNKEVRRTMRWVNIGVIVALVAVIVIFALQNLESVTMSFLGFRISAPLAVVAVVLYLLGMATGGSVWALMRWAWQGRKETSAS